MGGRSVRGGSWCLKTLMGAAPTFWLEVWVLVFALFYLDVGLDVLALVTYTDNDPPFVFHFAANLAGIVAAMAATVWEFRGWLKTHSPETDAWRQMCRCRNDLGLIAMFPLAVAC